MALTLKFAEGDSTRVRCPTYCSVCGGVPPYIVSTTKGSITILGANNYRIDPPANPGSAVAGAAWGIASEHYVAGGFSSCLAEFYKCDGTVHTACTGVGINSCTSLVIPSTCVGGCVTDQAVISFYCNASSPGTCPPKPFFSSCCDGLRAAYRGICDLRSQPMKDQGCNPCPVSLVGAVITVTDKDGTQVSRTLTNV